MQIIDQNSSCAFISERLHIVPVCGYCSLATIRQRLFEERHFGICQCLNQYHQPHASQEQDKIRPGIYRPGISPFQSHPTMNSALQFIVKWSGLQPEMLQNAPGSH